MVDAEFTPVVTDEATFKQYIGVKLRIDLEKFQDVVARDGREVVVAIIGETILAGLEGRING